MMIEDDPAHLYNHHEYHNRIRKRGMKGLEFDYWIKCDVCEKKVMEPVFRVGGVWRITR